jgi:hypothetical protein
MAALLVTFSLPLAGCFFDDDEDDDEDDTSAVVDADEEETDVTVKTENGAD